MKVSSSDIVASVENKVRNPVKFMTLNWEETRRHTQIHIDSYKHVFINKTKIHSFTQTNTHTLMHAHEYSQRRPLQNSYKNYLGQSVPFQKKKARNSEAFVVFCLILERQSGVPPYILMAKRDYIRFYGLVLLFDFVNCFSSSSFSRFQSLFFFFVDWIFVCV